MLLYTSIHYGSGTNICCFIHQFIMLVYHIRWPISAILDFDQFSIVFSILDSRFNRCSQNWVCFEPYSNYAKLLIKSAEFCAVCAAMFVQLDVQQFKTVKRNHGKWPARHK